MSNSSIWPIDRSLWGGTPPGQSGPRSDSNEGLLHIPQISKSAVLPSGGLELYSEQSL